MNLKGSKASVHVVGVKGVPGNYGGFETLAQQLSESEWFADVELTVYCEKGFLKDGKQAYDYAERQSLAWLATGWQSIFFDLMGMWKASQAGAVVLVLGTSATIFLPLFKLIFPSVRFVVNMAGLEWSRDKWGPFGKTWLKLNEGAAARFADVLVADNIELVNYVKEEYQVDASYIPYGGDQSQRYIPNDNLGFLEKLPESFDLAIARAQVDNNITMVLDAYAKSSSDLVFLSNWSDNQFGRLVRTRYKKHPHLHLVDAIYEQETLLAIKEKARIYVHGHSAGGTNPVLVEMMSFGLPVIAYGVNFNMATTAGRAEYFLSSQELLEKINSFSSAELKKNSESMRSIAEDRYRWDLISRQYLSALIVDNQ